ncbi:MAG TPA: methionyl-tRNA formyltransferase [Candidatus Acidoferrales bacterium]|nr:methionyl-tRNA formyltransferase [Candidatus Acidoferrales bacterium]
MRIVFCGTPEFAVPTLRKVLLEPDIAVEAVVTQPDRPRGRGRKLTASPVKEAALEAGLHVYQPEEIKSESASEFFRKIAPDAVVVIAYGLIIPASLLGLPRLGWLNLHASLLPKYRGAAPINWAIMNGDSSTGITTMQISAGLDTGPILQQLEMKIGPDETAPELAARMAEAGGPLLIESLKKLDRGELAPVPQDDRSATRAPLLKKELGRIDWTQSAQGIYDRIRGLAPWPGAYTTFRGQLCHIWGAPAKDATAGSRESPGTIIADAKKLYVVCGEGTRLALEAAQLEGKSRISARDFANGARLAANERFGK